MYLVGRRSGVVHVSPSIMLLQSDGLLQILQRCPYSRVRIVVAEMLTGLFKTHLSSCRVQRFDKVNLRDQYLGL